MNIDLDLGGVVFKAPQPKEMFSHSLLADGRTKYRINYSSLSMMQECWRKFDYSIVRGLRNNLESPATLFGTAIHKALEVFYSGKRTERTLPPKYRELMESVGCGQWQTDWEEYLVLRAARAFVRKAQPLAQLPDDNKRSIVTGVWMLTHYFERYLTDEYVVLTDDKGPVVERGFSMQIFEDAAFEVELFGTIDAVFKSDVTGLILGCDHKTTSSLYDFYDGVKPNHQYTAYSWAINKVLGYDTDQFLVNALQVKPPPKTARGSPPDFARQVTSRNQADYDDLLFAVVTSLGMFRQLQQIGDFPMTAPGPCTKFGGCQFRDVCSAPKELQQNIIKAKFKEIA